MAFGEGYYNELNRYTQDAANNSQRLRDFGDESRFLASGIGQLGQRIGGYDPMWPHKPQIMAGRQAVEPTKQTLREQLQQETDTWLRTKK